jgi:hypothetical protein
VELECWQELVAMIGLSKVGRSSHDEMKGQLFLLLVDTQIACDTQDPMDCILVTQFYLK